MADRQSGQQTSANQEETKQTESTVQLDAPLRQLMQNGRPSVADVVAVMRKHPMARIAMMQTLHRELGNQFAHEVNTELTQSPLVQQGPKSVFDLAKGGDLTGVVENGHKYESWADQQIGTLNALLPNYSKARSALDRDAVMQIGMVVMSSLELLRAAVSGLGEQLGQGVEPGQSVPGGDLGADLESAARYAELARLKNRHKELSAAASTVQLNALMTMTPREFRGSPLDGDITPTAHVDGKGNVDVRRQVSEELSRTVTLIQTAERLFIQFSDPKALQDPAKRMWARRDIAEFARRPADLMFLRAALSSAGLWQELNSEEDHKSAAKKSPLDIGVCRADDGPLGSLVVETKKQAAEMGSLTDIGNYDRGLADMDIQIGSSEAVTGVYSRIMSASPDGRAQILYQMQRRGMFMPLIDKLPWAYTKDIHDGLPTGHGELKSELQKKFLVEGKWGTSLAVQEYHAPSVTKMLKGAGDDVGGFGEDLIDGFDTALNFATLGFSHSYGAAQDAHSQGLITDDEYATSLRQITTRTAVGMAIMMATAGYGRSAGLAGGTSSMGAANVSRSAAGTALATGVEGATFATAEMFALDTTDLITGAKTQYSDLDDYLKVAMVGGALGGAMGGTSKFMSNRVAAKYLDPSMMTRGQALAAQHPNLSPVLQELQTLERGASAELRLTVTQVDDLARAGLIDEAAAKTLRDALGNNQEVRALVELQESLNEASIHGAGSSGKGKPPTLAIRNATQVQTGDATATAAKTLQAALPKDAIIKRVGGHGNDGWVQYELNGQQRLRFRAVEAKTLKEANPGRNMSTEEGAAINQNGEAFVLEGRHRAIGAAKGNTIGPDLGGVPGQSGVLDYPFRPFTIDEPGVFVRDLDIDYAVKDVSRAEADFIRSQGLKP